MPEISKKIRFTIEIFRTFVQLEFFQSNQSCSLPNSFENFSEFSSSQFLGIFNLKSIWKWQNLKIAKFGRRWSLWMNNSEPNLGRKFKLKNQERHSIWNFKLKVQVEKFNLNYLLNFDVCEICMINDYAWFFQRWSFCHVSTFFQLEKVFQVENYAHWLGSSWTLPFWSYSFFFEWQK